MVSCGSKSLQIWLRRAIIQNKRQNYESRVSQIGSKVSPSTQQLRFKLNIQLLYVTNVTNSLQTFLLQQKDFLANMAQTCDSFPQKEVLCFHNATNFSMNTGLFVNKAVALNRFFFLTEVLLFLQAHWFSNCGGEWHEPSIYIPLVGILSGTSSQYWAHQQAQHFNKGLKHTPCLIRG